MKHGFIQSNELWEERHVWTRITCNNSVWLYIMVISSKETKTRSRQQNIQDDKSGGSGPLTGPLKRFNHHRRDLCSLGNSSSSTGRSHGVAHLRILVSIDVMKSSI